MSGSKYRSVRFIRFVEESPLQARIRHVEFARSALAYHFGEIARQGSEIAIEFRWLVYDVRCIAYNLGASGCVLGVLAEDLARGKHRWRRWETKSPLHAPAEPPRNVNDRWPKHSSPRAQRGHR
jgi:hypothetical protein